jgi:type I restriction enzyme, R subunit
MNEAETRAEHIDPALAKAGWGVVEGSRIRREYCITLGRLEGHGKRGKPLTADYVLMYRNTKLAVVEAKPWDAPLTEGVGQAKNYAGMLAVRFTYSTNGRGVYGIDMQEGKEGEETCWPTPDELWARTFAKPNAWRDRFAAVPYEDRGGSFQGRYYQETAVDHVLEAIAKGQDRILLTLATGTGKTFVAFQVAWKLFQSRWNLGRAPDRRPRILFLADRNILADQAYNAFSAFPEDAQVRIAPEDIRKKGRVPKNGSLFFTIFQTFMSGPPKDGKPSPYFGEYPPDFFDFIVIDECHRGGANDESTWRAILDYFRPAVQLGLTATPKRKDNVDTYAYFGEPVYVYSLREGINDGFLTPFRVKQISTTLDEYTYTSDDTVVEGEVEAGKRYEEADFNRIIEIKEREKYRVRLFMDQIDQNEKTLVFCANQPHALAVRDLINQMKTSKDPNYCHRVTADDGALGEQHLRAFQDNEKTIPTILTTSQKLSTGVDARNIRNIVLMRPIHSIIEFKQIIGRGTRLFDGKDYFTIYDFVKAHHHFSDPEWDGEPLEPEPPRPPRPAPDDGPEPPPGPPPGPPRPERVKVRLADGKERTLQHMMATTFWGPDGKPLSAAQFLESLFGALPALFRDEQELRRLWSNPETRKQLLDGLAERGFGHDHLAEMQRLISAEKSDLYDVLAFVAFASPPVERSVRADEARRQVRSWLSVPQAGFIEFVLGQYVRHGVEELALDKLTPLLRLKYSNSVADATKDLGSPEEIRKIFIEFQGGLYRPVRVA